VRDNRVDSKVHKGRMQTGRRTAYAGSRLKLPTIQEGTAWKANFPAVLGKNPPYGILPDFHYRTFRRSVVLIAIKLAVRSRLKRRLTKIVTLWGLDDYLPKQA
jgi:hypothetical protein